MQKFNSWAPKNAIVTRSSQPYGATHIPNVGWKMYERTSESAGSIR